ncbi:hypothetical protein, partial [Klebsiella pneumoniae]|uniref:hypothetical protein n=1 Tax=Klebsiella pneumoniae TaxID=573 RepID=UPI0027310A47
ISISTTREVLHLRARRQIKHSFLGDDARAFLVAAQVLDRPLIYPKVDIKALILQAETFSAERTPGSTLSAIHPSA